MERSNETLQSHSSSAKRSSSSKSRIEDQNEDESSSVVNLFVFCVLEPGSLIGVADREMMFGPRYPECCRASDLEPET